MGNHFISSLTGFHQLGQTILNHLPHHIGVKNANSVIVGANDSLATAVGFKNASKLIGLRDDELNCGAAKLHEQFQRQDQQTLMGYEQQNLDFCYYADNTLQAFLSKKTKLSINDIDYVLFSMTELPLQKIVRLFGNLYESNNFSIEKFSGSYRIQSTRSAISSKANQPMTPRQSQCMFYLLRGSSNKRIAEQLKISARTVDDHIDNLKQAFNCDTRAQLIEKGFSLGLGYVIPSELFDTVTF